ncbi:hypothetical protein BOX15_Mlig018171g6 [Macrostomum lignano]|uniref:UDP-N-acetylglucosamine transferase subunit ALG13 n=1 Tax=Macrostomum lignano TaxID=282301 RepID=A0A267E1U3_9PLAT|nr:hypothetical protein BOX15_Mlig028521g3 [Macrostomum lignano]PAA54847.1 hypothetical protein BOX15_Mlig029619g3 [Macrostomum lignano]PAA82842.1 hypothetical protein BOX15_Mlig018171g6 [Macrostomum lignano]
MPNVFATVGTTSFDALIRRLDSPELHKILCDQLGYHGLVMQIGRGDYEPVAHTARDYPLEGRFSVSYYRFKPSLAADIAAAGLVISHAGAGSVLESLNAGKRLLVVVNDDLMHNHQTELAHRVARDGHLDTTVCVDLEDALKRLTPVSQLKPFPRGEPEKFAKFLDSVMGFGDGD